MAKKITKKKVTKKKTVKKTATSKRTAGRPEKPVYSPEMCEQLIEHMKFGLSFASFAGIAGVSRSTLYEWLKDEDKEDFKNAYELAQNHCLLFWERTGIDLVLGARGNASVYVFNMANRFPKDYKLNRDSYEEKQASSQDTDLTINLKYNSVRNTKDDE